MVLSRALQKGDLALVQCLQEQQQLVRLLPQADDVDDAAQAGCEALLEWLVGQPGCLDGPGENPYVDAAEVGGLGTLSALRRLGVPWGSNDGLVTAIKGRCCEPALRWLVEQGLPVGGAGEVEEAVARVEKWRALGAEAAAWLRGLAAGGAAAATGEHYDAWAGRRAGWCLYSRVAAWRAAWSGAWQPRDHCRRAEWKRWKERGRVQSAGLCLLRWRSGCGRWRLAMQLGVLRVRGREVQMVAACGHGTGGTVTGWDRKGKGTELVKSFLYSRPEDAVLWSASVMRVIPCTTGAAGLALHTLLLSGVSRSDLCWSLYIQPVRHGFRYASQYTDGRHVVIHDHQRRPLTYAASQEWID